MISRVRVLGEIVRHYEHDASRSDDDVELRHATMILLCETGISETK